jgi:hypothetical protein
MSETKFQTTEYAYYTAWERVGPFLPSHWTVLRFLGARHWLQLADGAAGRRILRHAFTDSAGARWESPDYGARAGTGSSQHHATRTKPWRALPALRLQATVGHGVDQKQRLAGHQSRTQSPVLW